MENLSVLGSVWREQDYDELLTQKILQDHDVTEIVARILAKRNIKLEKIQDFLDPKVKNTIPSPFHLLDMKRGVDYTIDAIKNKKNICIYGDYDVDGATSSAIIKNYLSNLGLESRIYIPDRLTEGYGPSIAIFEKLKNQNIDLVITVDCGTSSFEELKYAKSISLDVIVIDHHIANNIPEAVAVINPNRIDETTEYRHLAAVGVSFLFLCGIHSLLKKEGYFQDREEPDLIQSLDLVALGTICDIMQLDMLNRAFVSIGLKVMARRNNTGLAMLSDISGINTAPSTYNLGFIIGPRINAGGRVGESHLGSSLLSCKDEIFAREIAMRLEIYNNERKDIERLVLDEALNLTEPCIEDHMIFVHSNNWHVGVIGIIASRLKERFQKPSFVVSIENGIGKGSARSVKGIDLGSIIIDAKTEGLLVNGGGHAMAGGFTIQESMIIDFKKFIKAKIENQVKSLKDLHVRNYDISLHLSGVNLELANQFHILSPYGPGNREPLVKIDNLYVVKADLRAEKHISCILADTRKLNKNFIQAIAYNVKDTQISDILLSNRYSNFSLIGTISKNIWNGAEKIQIIIKDIIV